jgi:glycosyltransferase involved in cell wall biosynthesis
LELRISVVTINLNNLSGLIKTFESVLIQEYNFIEYLIIDGGSTDGSVEFIKSNQVNIDYWESKKDKGIYDAMNKGIQKSNGDYILFLNSGDYFFNSLSLKKLIEAALDKDIVYGNMIIEKFDGREVKTYPKVLSLQYFQTDTIPHPCSLIRKELFLKYGFYNTNYKIISDWAFFVDSIVKRKASYAYLDTAISVFNLNGISSQPLSYKVIRSEMNIHFKKNYFLFYVYHNIIWSMNYYPKRLLEKIRIGFKK